MDTLRGPDDVLAEITERLNGPSLDVREKQALANLLASTLEMFDEFVAERRGR
jgi:hypothetical protein